ncbi:MAG TPA: glutaminyl-peptide cyclotransferase [Flavobacterium sp.]|nr:glutaminyl-peptide cyclotransferase [Flavobacterium sp.]
MKTSKLFAFTSLCLLAVSCGKDDPFAIDESNLQAYYKNGDKLNLAVANPGERDIDSVAWFVDGKRVAAGEKLTYTLANLPLGYREVTAKVYAGDVKPEETSSRVEIVASTEPAPLSYTVVNTYPHDVEAFTEGLEFYRDTLIESTGQKGKSWIRKYDYKTGKVFRQQDLSGEYFGEGITVFGGKIYQLTWQEKTGFIYNADTWKLEKKFTYDQNIEGWGMTHNDTHIFQSDGTEKIWKVDPATQKHLSFVNVYAGTRKIKAVNELEYANGKIYGNVWQKDLVAVIDPATGVVEKVLDFSKLRKELKSSTAEVLNGIAYNPKTNTFFITGKNWDKLFEVRLAE